MKSMIQTWTARKRRLFVSIIGAAMLLLSSHAFAQYAQYTCSQTGEGNVTASGLPSSVSVGRDSNQLRWLTGWIRIETWERRYTCAHTDSWNSGVFSTMWVSQKGSTGQSLDGYTIYPTSVPGIGYAVRTYSFYNMDWVNGYNGCGTSAWIGPTDLSTSPPWWGAAVNGQSNMWCGGVKLQMGFGGAPEIALVQYGQASAGTVSPEKIFYYMVYGHGDAHYGGGGNDRNYFLPSIQVNLLSCVTPDVTVDLGSHAASTLPAAGSMTPSVNFDFKINSCPPGIGAFKYQINSWEKQAAPGVISARSSRSTATGVGVKMMWRDDSPVLLDTTMDKVVNSSGVQTTNPSAGGNFTMPMKASMIRLGAAPVTAGTVFAEAEVSIWYQ